MAISHPEGPSSPVGSILGNGGILWYYCSSYDRSGLKGALSDPESCPLPSAYSVQNDELSLLSPGKGVSVSQIDPGPPPISPATCWALLLSDHRHCPGLHLAPLSMLHGLGGLTIPWFNFIPWFNY